MQITTILGSPRKNGNTATVLELFEELMAQQGHEVDRINIMHWVTKPWKPPGKWLEISWWVNKNPMRWYT